MTGAVNWRHKISELSSLACADTPRPILSIVVPYYRDNPVPLIKALDVLCIGRQDVEILVYDDGTNDRMLTARVVETIETAKGAVRAFVAANNNGRAFARNFLMRRAKADWVLFLDADMLPVSDEFILKYMAQIKSKEADIIFGGFTVPQNSGDPDRELHRALSEVSDCLSLEDRRAAGPQYVASSNLAVRKTVMEAEPFDSEFSGWGWEDSEWAARTAKRYRLIHIDNPALHLGLETTDTLLKRFQTSGANYARFASKHPELAGTLALYRISQRLKFIPGQKWLRPLLRALVKYQALPLKLRLFALKLWRASWYAEAVS